MQFKNLKYFIKTYGCQMNIADSDRFAQIMASFGLRPADSVEFSDLVLVNSCVVRAKAEDKAIAFLADLEHLRRTKPNLRVILAGCLAPSTDPLALKKRFPSILFTVEPENIDNFRQMLSEHLSEITPSENVTSDSDSDDLLDKDLSDICVTPYHAFVNVMRGCEQFCTFCIVPSARGHNSSRKPDEIIREMDERIQNGAKAITLLGQSILDYGKDWVEEKSIKSIKDDDRFRELLDKVSNKFPDTWIKFLTSHPKDMTFSTVDLIASRKNISRFLHLPVQSGDNEILKRMGRGHTREYYFQLVDYIKEKIPDARLSSDIIVGFPGEDLDAFEQSMDLLRKVRFFKVFTFQYSIRSGTAAALMKDDISYSEKRSRLNRLIDLQNQITLERHREQEGSEIEVIVEGCAKDSFKMIMGRSLGEDVVIFENTQDLKPGDKAFVKITEGRQRTLQGEIVKR